MSLTEAQLIELGMASMSLFRVLNKLELHIEEGVGCVRILDDETNEIATIEKDNTLLWSK